MSPLALSHSRPELLWQYIGRQGNYSLRVQKTGRGAYVGMNSIQITGVVYRQRLLQDIMVVIVVDTGGGERTVPTATRQVILGTGYRTGQGRRVQRHPGEIQTHQRQKPHQKLGIRIGSSGSGSLLGAPGRPSPPASSPLRKEWNTSKWGLNTIFLARDRDQPFDLPLLIDSV